MPHIKWSDSLKIGVKQIDDQHKRLIDICNRLIDAVGSGLEEKSVKERMRDLREYTVYHFQDEEEFMAKASFPKREEHAAEHQKLVARVKDFQRRLYYRQALSGDEVRNFLKDWLIGHILGWDMEIKQLTTLPANKEKPKPEEPETA